MATSRTRLSAEDRRAQLLDLGAQMFAVRPYDEVLIEQVAEQAAVSRGLLYYYFPTKRDFFAALVRRESERMMADTLADVALSPLEQLRHGIVAYLDHIRANEMGFRAVSSGAVSADQEVRAIIEDATREQARRILSTLEPRREPHPLLSIAVRSWLMFLRAAGLEWLEHPGVARDAVRDLAIAALLGALSSLPDEGRPARLADLALQPDA
jgi:AcrR family transcriptional regulator